MLQTLSIQNVALIRSLSLTLDRGLNVLSGETGAGKSILIDAVNLVLGVRGDRDLIQYGQDRARGGVFAMTRRKPKPCWRKWA
ncbi:MAG: AAA family ATPase [Christensenellales bacterium]